MSLPITFHEAAEVEMNDAADYYDLESSGLGTAFLDEVERTLAKFPYSLLYSVHPEGIRVLAIAHQRRRPFYWRGRK